MPRSHSISAPLLLLLLVFFPVTAAAQQLPAGIQLPPGVQLPPGLDIEQMISQLTPAQRAVIIERLLAAETTRVTDRIDPTRGLLPTMPTADPLRGITRVRVDTTQFYIENPFDFAALADEADAVKKLTIFGSELFALAPDAFDPPTFGPVGPDYRLGPGDEVIITMWGSYQEEHVRNIEREGYILLPNIGQVVLASLTLEQARRRLLQTMTPYFEALNHGNPGATAFLDVSLGRLRAITVYVLGEVQNPGAFTLSSVSTVLSALYACRGTTNRGSLRAIRVIRGNRVVGQIDLYDFLLRGDRSRDIRLESEDILFVPRVGPQVAVTGRVVRPSIYEITPGERLADVLAYAGGPSPSALRSRAEVNRILAPEERGNSPLYQVLIDVDLDQQLSRADQSLPMTDGDVLRLLPIPSDRRNLVVVEGAVWNPGRIEHRPGMRLREALERAGGLREEALGSRVDITRTRPDETTEHLSTILARAMEGDVQHDLALEPRDLIRIYSIHDVYPRERISIMGDVRNPGSYLLHRNMSLMDLVARAGGLAREAWTEWAEVARLELAEDGSVVRFSIHQVPLDTSYTADARSLFHLKDYDQVFIRRRPQWQTERNVHLYGQVLFPGAYPLQRDNERLTEVIERAGGLTPYAYPEGARFYREFEKAGRINLRLSRALADPRALDNLIMQPGDSLYVPHQVVFVRVSGAVQHPSSVLYQPGKGPRYYIAQSGGFSDQADKRRTRVTLPNGSMLSRRFILPDPEVEPGSEIFVPYKPEYRRDTWETIRDTTALLSSLTTVLLLIWQVTR